MPNPLPPPTIGITSYGRQASGHFYLPHRYLQAVRQAGGLPIVLPSTDLPHPDLQELLAHLDGIIISGGGDIEPHHYGGSFHPAVYGVDPERDQFELSLAQLALQQKQPILGICRGHQILAVAGGGELIVHLPDAGKPDIAHRHPPHHPIEHTVKVAPHSRLASILGSLEVAVVSWHHQAVRRLPLGWIGVAEAEDGVLEAMEHSSHPWAVSVQWHPELDLGSPPQQNLLQAFVRAAHHHKYS
ncbi:MAG: gamma-glutamyl-gamma-aminobutyrate hydrolase family protein [Cyanobacteriota bacterium]|nr:gamma-glutamyl-gamma-aminobutyrate hydrolase family protein [Cyanobacteriota bacterium]